MILEKLVNGDTALSKSERKIASIVLNNPSKVINQSISDLSEAAEVSLPTVNRFCKKLGFDGYPSFKIRIAQELSNTNKMLSETLKVDADTPDIVKRVMADIQSTVINIGQNLDPSTIDKATKLLTSAKSITFFGLGGSGPVAMDGQHKFFRLKIPSSYISDPHLQFMSANSLEKNDVVVVISQSGTTAALIDSVKIVKKNGVKVIGIMPGDTPLANICDYPLTINVGINNRISKPLTSRIAYTAVIDVLTMGVAQLKPEAQDHLYNIADSQRSLKVDN